MRFIQNKISKIFASEKAHRKHFKDTRLKYTIILEKSLEKNIAEWIMNNSKNWTAAKSQTQALSS